MLPAVIHEQLIHTFNFYFNGAVCKGMAHQGTLYRLMQSFEIKNRTKAFAVACELSKRGAQTVVTASPNCYKIWIDLRYLAQAEPSNTSSSSAIASSDAASNSSRKIDINKSPEPPEEKLSFLADALELLKEPAYRWAIG